MSDPTGKFVADFNSFYVAVDKANAKMADFAAGADKVGPALNRMVDEFQGRRLVQELTLTAEAVERAGGVSKLTAKEINDLAAQAVEATEKMQKMGIVIPETVRHYTNELKAAKTETTGLDATIGKVAQSVAAAFAVERVLAFVGEIGKAEQALVRLATETQIGIDELQDLTAATKDYGLSNDELAKALFSTSQRIAGGDDSIARGLHLAGLSIDELKDKHGTELFLEIERGLSTLQGSARDMAAADIFGSKLGPAMAGFAATADSAIKKAAELPKLTRDQATELARYAGEVDKASASISTLFTKWVKFPIAQTLNATSDALKSGLPWWKLAIAAGRDHLAVMSGNAAGAHNAADLLAGYNKEIKATADAHAGAAAETEQHTVALTDEQQAERFLSTLRVDAAKELEPYQIRGLESLREMGQLNQQNAAAIGVGADQYKLYTEKIQQAESATRALTAATLENAAQAQKLANEVTKVKTQQTGTQTENENAALDERMQNEIDAVTKRHDATLAAMRANRSDTKANLDLLEQDYSSTLDKIRGSFGTLREGIGIDFKAIRDVSLDNLQDIADRAGKTYREAFSNPAIGREQLEGFERNMRKALDDVRNYGHAASDSQAGLKAKIDDSNRALADQARAARKVAEVMSTVEYDLSSSSGRARFLAAGGTLGQAATPEYFDTHTLADAIAEGLAQVPGFNPKWGNTIKPTTTTAGGPMAPGVTPIAPTTAAAAPAAPGEPVVPGMPSRGKGAGLQVFAPVYVSGVFDPASAQQIGKTVSTAIAARVTAGRVMR